MGIARSRSEHQHMQSPLDKAESLKPSFAIVLARVFNDQCARPLELGGPVERDSALGDAFLVLSGVIGDGRLFIVYTLIRAVKSVGHNESVEKPIETPAARCFGVFAAGLDLFSSGFIVAPIDRLRSRIG